MTVTEARGNVLMGQLGYMQSTYPKDKQERILAALPRDVVAVLRAANRSDWYPASAAIEVFKQIALAHHDPAVAHGELAGAGRFICIDGVNGFMKFLIKVMTPRLFALKLPGFFTRHFRNTPAELVVDTSGITDNRLRATFVRVESLPYMPAAAAGWISYALESMGQTDVRVGDIRGQTDAWNSSEVTLEATWR